jgi:lycopene beta-cyclase
MTFLAAELRRPAGAAVDADVVILGGGCAGLSLAAHLASSGGRLGKVLVVEARKRYADDRTFSFWSGSPTLFADCVQASWNRWRIEAGARRIERGAPGLRYETIGAGRFYAAATSMIAASPNVRLLQGVTTLALDEDGDAAWVSTDHGRIRTRLVVDTRPPPVLAAASGLLQLFTGWEVETAQPAFDPDVVELMHFDPPHARHVGFTYVLPFSPTRALVEYTRLAADFAEAPTDAEVQAIVAARAGSGFRVVRRESGALTMRVEGRRKSAGPRMLRLGTLGGAARASTGYAFTAIEAQAASLAASLQDGWKGGLNWTAPALPFWLREMDRVFLRALRRNMHAGPALFADLFDRCPPQSLVRFLTGSRNPADAAAAACALPVLPVLRHGVLGLRA